MLDLVGCILDGNKSDQSLTSLVLRVKDQLDSPFYTITTYNHVQSHRRYTDSVNLINHNPIPGRDPHPCPSHSTTRIPDTPYRLDPSKKRVPRCRSGCTIRNRKIARTSYADRLGGLTELMDRLTCCVLWFHSICPFSWTGST